MNATITKTIWDEIDALHADPSSDGSSKHCVTIEGESAMSWGSFWIQLYAGSINFRHLDDAQRDEVLGMILDPIDTPDDMQLLPGECVTFDINAMGRPVVDAMLVRLINEYFQILDGVALDVSTEEF
jgi:hypothetical protein